MGFREWVLRHGGARFAHDEDTEVRVDGVALEGCISFDTNKTSVGVGRTTCFTSGIGGRSQRWQSSG